jgi:hypothetical protein
MNHDLLIFLPNIILLVLFILFLWRRHSLKSLDWVTLVCITLGVSLLAIVIVQILKNQTAETESYRVILIAIPSIMLLLFLLFLTRVFTVEKMKSKFHFDERITLINAKSARNALMAVYLSSVIDLLIYENITRVMLLVILAVSLIVYLASMVIYYFRSF